GRAADLDAVAELAVTAGAVVGRVRARVVGFVAGVGRAGHVVVAVRRGPRHAALARAAGLDAVAELAVVAERVVRVVHAGLVRFRTGIGRARDVVVAVGRRAGLAALRGIADFDAVAEVAVAARSVVRRVHAAQQQLVADVGRAGHAVVAVGR